MSGTMKRLTGAVRLTPEGVPLETLKSVTRQWIAQGHTLLTFSLHSTSLTPGASPYARTQDDVDQMGETTAAYLTWFHEELGGRFMQLADLDALQQPASSPSIEEDKTQPRKRHASVYSHGF